MARYIDENLLLQQVAHINSTVEQGVKYFNSVYNLIQKQPIADVVEVKHGYWKIKIKNGRPRGLKCSLCGRSIHFHEDYCPTCGAKMDGKDINVPTK